jgi:two-component system, OmpR family, sensor kinase
MLTQQQSQAIDGHLSREAGELQILATKAIDPKTDTSFTSAKGLLELYVQRTVPDPNETMFVVVNGSVISRTTDTPAVRLDQDPEFLALVNQVTKAGFGNYQTAVGNARYIVVPITSPDERGALVGIIFSDLESKQISDLLYRFALIVLLSLIAAAAVGWLVAGRVLRPITKVRQTAHEIGASDLSKRIADTSGGTELMQLAAEFNLMLDRIQESFEINKQFVDDAGHELRTPLTIISGHLELMEADPSQADSSMVIVKDELSRMSRIVRDLQTLTKSSQPDFIKRTEISLVDLGDELFVKASQLGNRNWSLGEIPEASWSLDRERITQAILQISENAIRFTSDGDPIRIDIQLVGKSIEVSVSDSGPGIPEASRDRITERFVRGEAQANSGQGAGLGLALVSAIAEGHGGKLVIGDSEFGGAKVTLRIPR